MGDLGCLELQCRCTNQLGEFSGAERRTINVGYGDSRRIQTRGHLK
jgi:hypothetical protein